MQGGDISNEVSPRLCLVFEGLVGVLPPRNIRKEAVARKFGQWKRVVGYYEVNPPIAARIWDIQLRSPYGIEVVTWMPEQAVDFITDWIDKEELPVGRVFNSTPQLLSRSIAYRPILAAIYDPDPAHRFTYGGKGRYVVDATTVNLLGSS